MDEEKLTIGLRRIKSLLEASYGFLSFDESCAEKSVEDFRSLLNTYMEAAGFVLPKDEPGAASSCGHIFEHGDVIYHCKDCTHDETCVLCSKCFNDDDHVGHRISFSVSKGSGGSCDCGEDESWNRPLHCPSHRSGPALIGQRPEMDDVLAKFFHHLLCELVPSIVQPYPSMKIDMASSLDQIVSLVLFNDEKHSYEDVITILHHSTMLSGHPNAERTPEHYAKTIDHYGLASLGEDTGRNLLSTAATIRSIGLQVEAFSLENAQSWIFAHYFVSCVAAAVENQPILREPLIKALLESDNEEKSFLEKILSADHWLTKGLRKDFNRILVKCALSDAATKQKVGLVYGSCFPSMLDLFLEGDREPEHSLVHFSVQLFTVSSVITSLVMETRFYGEICSIAQAYFQASPNMIEQLPKKMISDTAMLLTVLRYVFKDPSVRKAGFFADPINFMHFADAFIEPLEGINHQSREVKTHVLFESRKWTTSFTLQIQVCDVLFLYLDLMDDLSSIESVLELLAEEYEPYSVDLSLHSLLVTCISFLIRKVFQLSENKDEAIKIIGALVRKSSFSNFLSTSIRMIQFSSEIEAGLWVRNGLSMSSQLHLFRYSPYRFYFWDAAICCLKAFLLCASFDEFLDLVLSCWPQQVAEDSLITPVVFEFSRFLMSVIYGVSFSWITDENLVAEAVDALLFSGPYSFSDLEQLLPEHWISLDCFSGHLSEHSKEKMGDELGNHVFDVNPSQFHRFCPFYFLYSPEIRERAMERLSTESYSSDPFVLSFLSSSPLSMNEFTLIPSKPPPELIVELAHQLLKSGVKSHLSLGLALSYLLFPRDNLIPFIAGFFNGLSEISRKFIRSQLNQSMGVSAAHLDLILFESSPAPKDLASNEAKRRALERISKARKGFLETSVPLDESASIDASDNDLSSSNFPYAGLKSSCCVICQAPVDTKSPIGILGFLRRSHIPGCSFLFSSCLHIIHLDCFKDSLAKAKIASCPLCSSVSNFYLAVETIKLTEFGSLAPHISAQTVDDLANWIKSGQLYLSCRRNFKNTFTDREAENHHYSFDSFRAALRAQGLETNFSAAKLVQDLTVRLKSLRCCNVEFVDCLESLRNIFRLVRNWIALDMCSELSCEVQGLADYFCQQDMLQKEICIPATLTCLLLNSSEDLSYSEKGLRLCQLVYCLSLRHMLLRGFMNKEIEKSEEIAFGLLEDLYFSMLICYNLPAITGQNLLEITEILGLPSLSSSLVEELLLDPKNVFGHFSAQLIISPPAVINFITLEERYDKLLLQYSSIYCAVCNQRPPSPALCLLCGILLCTNSSCCFDGDNGECNSHVLECGRNGGIFLLLRKNSVLLLGSPQFRWGKIFNSPYLDENGQTDPGLRRGKLLRLDHRRLEIIQKKWKASVFDSEVYRTDDHLLIDWTSF